MNNLIFGSTLKLVGKKAELYPQEEALATVRVTDELNNISSEDLAREVAMHLLACGVPFDKPIPNFPCWVISSRTLIKNYENDQGHYKDVKLCCFTVLNPEGMIKDVVTEETDSWFGGEPHYVNAAPIIRNGDSSVRELLLLEKKCKKGESGDV